MVALAADHAERDIEDLVAGVSGGDGDAEVFTRMFNAHIRNWQRQEQDRHARDRLSAAERSLGGRGRSEDR